MKKTFLLSLACALVACSGSANGGELTTTTHENGKTASKGYVITNVETGKSVKTGDWVYFYANGQKEMQGSYLEGEMHGTWQFWMSDGSQSWTDEYENGEGPVNGMFVDHHKNGQKWREGNRKSGNQEGVWTYWHDNGQKSNEGAYKSGKAEGVWTFWKKDGTVEKTQSYIDGKVVE